MIPLVGPKMELDDIEVLGSFYNSKVQLDFVQMLEHRFANLLNRKYGIALNSGTSALHLALLGLEIGPGDEVICSSYTCTAILNSILYTGATPILVDIVLDIPSTVFAMSIEEIKRKKTSKTKAIIFTHMFGKASDIEPLLKLGIPIIEDGTLSLGGSCNQVSVGEKGTISVFSLHETKVISAISGAVLVTDSNVILGRINNYLENSNHGKEFSLRYNYTLPPLHAALALNQLDKLDRFIDERKGLSIYYSDRLGCMSNQIITPTISEDNIFFRYILGIPQHIKPEELLKYCLTKGIELGRGIYPPLHQFLQLSGEQFTQTEEAVRSVVSIPVHPSISWSDAEYMMDCVIDYMTMCRAG